MKRPIPSPPCIAFLGVPQNQTKGLEPPNAVVSHCLGSHLPSLSGSASTPVGGFTAFGGLSEPLAKKLLRVGQAADVRLARERQEQYEGESILPID